MENKIVHRVQDSGLWMPAATERQVGIRVVGDAE